MATVGHADNRPGQKWAPKWTAYRTEIPEWYGDPIIHFDGAGVVDRARRDLPLNPEDVRWSWDALSGSLWNGITELGEERVAVVWTHAHELLAHDAEVLFDALEVFRQVAVALSEPPGRLRMIIALVGTGPSFKAFGG